MITGTTRVFALLGDPVAHSLSPHLQNAAFRVLGLPAVYVALRCNASDVPALLRGLAQAGGGGNVTVPHKETALGAIDQPSARGTAAGACNTFWGGETGVAGDNTDVPGLLAALHELEVPAGPWLVAGTGGGARAAVVAARECGAAVAILSRSVERQQQFERWIVEVGGAVAVAQDCRVVINTTPQGLQVGDDALPIAREVAPNAAVAFDMVYRRGETTWVRAMRAEGLRAADGRHMLVAQGAAAFARWFPGIPVPVEVMRAAVAAALR